MICVFPPNDDVNVLTETGVFVCVCVCVHRQERERVCVRSGISLFRMSERCCYPVDKLKG